jgi:hypothetical protein
VSQMREPCLLWPRGLTFGDSHETDLDNAVFSAVGSAAGAAAPEGQVDAWLRNTGTFWNLVLKVLLRFARYD